MKKIILFLSSLILVSCGDDDSSYSSNYNSSQVHSVGSNSNSTYTPNTSNTQTNYSNTRSIYTPSTTLSHSTRSSNYSYGCFDNWCEAGYEYGSDNSITNTDDCPATSDSFYEWCVMYIQDEYDWCNDGYDCEYDVDAYDDCESSTYCYDNLWEEWKEANSYDFYERY